MKSYYVLTLFPEMIMSAAGESITGRAIKSGKINVSAINIRDYSEDRRHGRVDDYPYGGGAGMLMQAQPICDCFEDLVEKLGHRPRVLYMSPQGRTFDQRMAEELSKEEDIVFLCGHYEGVDQRALDILDVEEVSIGDYVLTGGELPALVMIDTISRLVDGVLNKEDSHEVETFSDDLLEYPQYTRPAEYRGMTVPEILLSGDHKKVDKWRLEKSIEKTMDKRPDLYERYMGQKSEKA